MQVIEISICQKFLEKLENLSKIEELDEIIFDFKTELMKVEEQELTNSDFDTCWAMYQKKGSRKVSLERWKKLSSLDKEKIKLHIPIYNSSRDIMYRKDFERYISNRTFEDVVIMPKKPWEAGSSQIVNNSDA